jgi:hypothetical protein
MHSTSLISRNSIDIRYHHSPVVGQKGHRGSVLPNLGSISSVITAKPFYRGRAVNAQNTKASQQDPSFYFTQRHQHPPRVDIVCVVLPWPLTAKAGICASRLTPNVQSRHPQRPVRVRGSSIGMTEATEGERRVVLQNSDLLELVGTLRDVGHEVRHSPVPHLRFSYY